MKEPFPAPPIPPVPPLDKSANLDQRIRAWMSYILGFLIGAFEGFVDRPIQPGLIAFSVLLLGAPTAEKLWTSRKDPE